MAIATALFLTDAELASRLGIKADLLAGALLALDKEGFPSPDPLFGGRRYWPACEAFFDRRYGLAAPNSPPPGLDGEENWS